MDYSVEYRTGMARPSFHREKLSLMSRRGTTTPALALKVLPRGRRFATKLNTGHSV